MTQITFFDFGAFLSNPSAFKGVYVKVPFKEIENKDPKRYQMLFDVAFHWVKEQAKTEKGRKVINSQGLEGTTESTLSLIEKGHFTIISTKEGLDAFQQRKSNKFKRLLNEGQIKLVQA